MVKRTNSLKINIERLEFVPANLVVMQTLRSQILSSLNEQVVEKMSYLTHRLAVLGEFETYLLHSKQASLFGVYQLIFKIQGELLNESSFSKRIAIKFYETNFVEFQRWYYLLLWDTIERRLFGKM